MNRVAFRMRLKPGFEQEYEVRHSQIWPELSALLRQAGVQDYRIFMDPETLALFAIMEIQDNQALDRLPDHPVMKRWWAYMADIMEVEADQSPTSIALKSVFCLARSVEPS